MGSEFWVVDGRWKVVGGDWLMRGRSLSDYNIEDDDQRDADASKVKLPTYLQFGLYKEVKMQ